MALAPHLRTRKLTIVAQDPAIRIKGRIITAKVDVPAEELMPGPWGYRVHVVDYDASTEKLYQPPKSHFSEESRDGDPFHGIGNQQILSNPGFHAQNSYAIVMRILARFEFALGRRVSWSFYGHQIKVAPHAFADANAFYTKDDQALLFGYFPGRKGMVFSCLSHDILAHETTHALLDGLRERYTDASSPDQAAFHEGFADIVALLSVFALPEVVGAIIDLNTPDRDAKRIARNALKPEALRSSVLMGLAKEMGQELLEIRGGALRQSALLKPSKKYLDEVEYKEPHRRGEVLVAAVMNAFLEVWSNRLKSIGEVAPGQLDRQRVVEEGALVADYLLTMCIRALDYAPPVHMEFGHFLSAVLTSDSEINPDDSRFKFREKLFESFQSYGINPVATGTPSEPGIWDPCDASLNYERTHFESMQRAEDEVFRFIWDNQKPLRLYQGAYARVLSVRPCLRIGPDGFALRETVAEYMQILELTAAELRPLKIRKPDGMPADQRVTLYGGATLIFNEYGRLKFQVYNRIDDDKRQSDRLDYLWSNGFLNRGTSTRRDFSNMHRLRALNTPSVYAEEW